MIYEEPKLMVSESIKEQFEDSQEENAGESLIAILTFLELDGNSFISSILRGISLTGDEVRFNFSSNSIKGIEALLSHVDERESRFQCAFIEYLGAVKKIELSEKKLVEARITKIDFEKQTCDCEFAFQ